MLKNFSLAFTRNHKNDHFKETQQYNLKRIETLTSLFPGFGFFGHTPQTGLHIEVQGEIDSAEISFLHTQKTVKLKEIQFLDGHGEGIPQEKIVKRVFTGKGKDRLYSPQIEEALLSGGPISIDCRRFQTLKLELRKHYVSQVRILNHNDAGSANSRFLVFSAKRKDKLVSAFENVNSSKFIEFAEAKIEELGLLKEKLYQVPARAALASFEESWREKIGSEAKRVVEKEARFHLHWAPELTLLRSELLAQEVVSGLSGKNSIPTSTLDSFSKLLDSDIKVLNLERKINELMNTEPTNERVIISKHLIHKSILLQDEKRGNRAIHEVIRIGQILGIPIILGYGTLLGAVRHSGPIAHDDDVDLIALFSSSSHEDSTEERLSLATTLQKEGHSVSKDKFWHLQCRVFGVSIDIFPLWFQGTEAMAVMEKLQIRPLPKNIILPASTIAMSGEKFPAPQDSEAFLRERYGPDWRTPDQFHEWRWPIQRLLNRSSKNSQSMAFDKSKQDLIFHHNRTRWVAWGQYIQVEGEKLPANSLELLTHSVELGFDVVEVDIRRSRDGGFFLGRDDSLKGPNGFILLSQSDEHEISNFVLSSFEGRDVKVPSLQDAMRQVNGKVQLQIDARLHPDHFQEMKHVVKQCSFPESDLQFCVYGPQSAMQLRVLFPDSYLFYKTYLSVSQITDSFLDEAASLEMDGVMVSLEGSDEMVAELMTRSAERHLSVLLFVVSGVGGLTKVIKHDVDYATTQIPPSKAKAMLDETTPGMK